MKQRSRVTAIVNPAAGGDRERAVAALAAVGTAEVDTVRTTGPGAAVDLAHKLAVGETRPDMIVAVGGDGTVGEVVTGLHRATESGADDVPPLLIAPAGTGNSCYRAMWDDAPFEHVARAALGGDAVVRRLDLARIEENEHVMLLGSGSGLFAASLLAVRGRSETGRELLMAAALAAMRTYVPYPGRVVVDGRILYEGGTAGTDMNQFAQAAVRGRVYGVPGIMWGRGTRVAIERTDGEPMLFEHDGEVMPRVIPSYTSTVLPAALSALTSPAALPWFRP
jgi:diacylglycerol kinase (ATP)